MKRFIALIVTIVLILGFGGAGTLAEAGVNPAGEPASDPEQGYIFKINETAAESGCLEDALQEDAAEPVYAPEGLYVTEDLSVIRELTASGEIEYWEPNATVTLFEEYGLSGVVGETSGSTDGWVRKMLGYSYAREQGITGKGVRIGIIDSGLAEEYAAYTDAVIETGCSYTTSGGASTEDTYGHGTAVCSVITSRDCGLAPEVTVIPLKCFNNRNDGTIGGITQAVYEAVDVYDCDVVNMSLGVSADYPSLADAVEYARRNGVTVVAVAGNLPFGMTSTGQDSAYYPGAYESVIGVGAVDYKKAIWSRSVQNVYVNLAAPGKDVDKYNISTHRFDTGSGTSYATPAVTAAVALALSENPGLTPEEIDCLVTETAEDLGAEGRDNAFGYGLLNLGLFLTKALGDEGRPVVSEYNGKTCLSCWFGANSEEHLDLLSFYAGDGRLIEAWFADPDAGMLNNVEETPGGTALPENGRCCSMRLDPQNWMPLTEAKNASM